MVDADRFTATDALALDVDMVERWAREVVADGDSPTPLLVALVTRLRAVADLLADHLYRTSEPDAGSGCGCGYAAPRRTGFREPVKQGPGRDSGARPQGVASGPERSVPEAPTATNQGHTPHDCTA